MRSVLGIISCIIFIHVASAQQSRKYWVYFDQSVTLGAGSDSLEALGFSSEVTSTWLHAIALFVNESELGSLTNRSYVKDIQLVRSLEPQSINENQELLGFALEQIRADVLINEGLNGKGVKVGIIDGGFLKADKHGSLTRIFNDSLVWGYRDYLTPKLGAYKGSKWLDDHHGTEVWELIAGYHSEKKVQFGLATGAYYYLARTDHGRSEKRLEEDYFIEALEWLDSCGVKLVNSSLGYTYGYDDPSENYVPEQMDGSSAIAKAVQYAAEEKGMLIIVAAGNEGDKPKWLVLNTPADAKDVLAVGATKLKLMDKMKYSSIGPDFLPYMKPEVSCFAANGTSFSTPIITGLAACIWQYDPSLTNYEVKALIEKSCTLYPYGNNYVGFGVPDAQRLLTLLRTGQVQSPVEEVSSEKNKIVLELSEESNTIIVYHKIQGWQVIERELYDFVGTNLKVKRFPQAEQSTVIAGEQIWEIFWEE